MKFFVNTFGRVFSFAIFWLIFFDVSAYGQSVVKGRVIGLTDKKPISNVNVFISNATIGDKTAEDGTFTLRGIRPGSYNLVVSIVGYDTYTQTVKLNNETITLPDIEIIPKAISLRGVVIKPRNDAEWDRNFALFKNGFLGRSDLAADCKIINPAVLDFDYDNATGILKASTGDFLQVQNNALGYNLKYLLSEFTIDKYEQTISYKGSVLFEKMKGSPSLERRWLKKRQEVYEGSEMHFLRSLLKDQLEQEGFRVLQNSIYKNPGRPVDSVINAKIEYFKKQRPGQGRYKDSLAFWKKKSGLPAEIKTLMRFPLSREDIFKDTDQPDIFAVGCEYDGLFVQYNKNHHFPQNPPVNDLDNRFNYTTTLVSFVEPYVFFDSNGWVIVPGSRSFRGGWAKYRIAGLLPSDYEPIPSVLPAQSALVAADTSSAEKQLLELKSISDTTNKKSANEKLYIQFDKPYYAVGDTIWLKGYLLNSPTLLLSSRSNLLHIDIANDSGRVIKQYLLPLQDGFSWGNISLNEKEFHEGNYVLRAYTQWMRNFGDDGFYYRRFRVAGVNENGWLVNSRINAANTGEKQLITANLQFTGLDKAPLANRNMQLKVVSGGRTLHRQDVKSANDGMLDVTFALPPKPQDLAIIAEDAGKKNKTIIPVILNNPVNADVQFLPEGGSLIAGIDNRIGFKAIGGDGKGYDVSGIIVDQDQKRVASFRSSHNGMGSFELLPQNGKNYSATVTLGGLSKTFPLPAVRPSGIILRVDNKAENDSLMITLTATKDIVEKDSSYFLIGKARGVICYAAIVSFPKEMVVTRAVPKDIFPTAVTHFILTTSRGIPLNERLIYINRNDNLNIKLTATETAYTPKDSVALQVKVTDNAGSPVAGNFSLAVTDDSQVRNDTLNADNILSCMLLTSELKGYVEEPGYYFQDKNKSTDLDNLLLTQGWVNYEAPANIKYPAETEYAVKGKVTNVFSKPVKATKVLILSSRPFIYRDTLTDNKGEFTFHRLPAVDTPVFVLQAVNRSGKSFNVGIQPEETPPPAFILPKAPLAMPWYVNSDSITTNFVKTGITNQKLPDYLPDGRHRLKGVVIKATKIVKGSQNLNGPGNADQVFDEKEMEQAGKKTWLDLFEEKIKGFREKSDGVVIQQVDSHTSKFIIDMRKSPLKTERYFVQDKNAVFIIDGVELDSMANMTSFNDLRTLFKFHNAEDIKGIEVNFSGKYTGKYEGRFSVDTRLYGISDIGYAFIEITTRAGHGPFFFNTPGVYLYKPLAVSWPAQFYKPKYMAKDTTPYLTTRSTIDWEPNITTDAEGKATVSFYAGTKPSTYTLIIEGIDYAGNLGYKRQKIVISKPKEGTKSK